MEQFPTLRDVAKLAGVSIGTVSHVLNHKAVVSPDTRARVLDAINTLGYRRRSTESTVESMPISVVGMFVMLDKQGPITTNPFYAHVLLGVERECQQQNLSLMFSNLPMDQYTQSTALHMMLDDPNTDALLIVGAHFKDSIEHMRHRIHKPIVLIDAYAPGNPFDSVISDNFNGAISAVNYLIEQGHRHIALIGSTPTAHPSIFERRRGYLHALQQRNITDVYIEDAELTSKAGYKSTQALLTRNPQITAIFACNDDVAQGVLEALDELNCDVPGNISVIGFDNVDFAQKLRPTLTTVNIDKVLLGTLGVRHLIERAGNLQRPPVTSMVGTSLVIRESVRSLR
jgi:LacI family transcriptional regulator